MVLSPQVLQRVILVFEAIEAGSALSLIARVWIYLRVFPTLIPNLHRYDRVILLGSEKAVASIIVDRVRQALHNSRRLLHCYTFGQGRLERI